LPITGYLLLPCTIASGTDTNMSFASDDNQQARRQAGQVTYTRNDMFCDRAAATMPTSMRIEGLELSVYATSTSPN
jgi:uncharacterized phosphosugar-binding protein